MSDENGQNDPKSPKEQMIEVLRQWLDEPGNTHRLTFEVSHGMNPATRQPMRLFSVKGEATFQQHPIPLPRPSIIPANGVLPNMPPGGKPPNTH